MYALRIFHGGSIDMGPPLDYKEDFEGLDPDFMSIILWNSRS